MVVELPIGVPESLYPLAWFVGSWTGSGQLGGHFGLDHHEFETTQSWSVSSSDNALDYLATLTVNGKPYLTQSGKWRVSKVRPETLKDEGQFPLDIHVTTTFAESSNPAFKTEYVGVVGYGRCELLSEKIDLLDPSAKFGDHTINDLYRSKLMLGWVNNRILWAWDLAFLGTELESFAAAGMWK